MAATYAASTIAFYVFARSTAILSCPSHGVRRGWRRVAAAVWSGAPRWRRRPCRAGGTLADVVVEPDARHHRNEPWRRAVRERPAPGSPIAVSRRDRHDASHAPAVQQPRCGAAVAGPAGGGHRRLPGRTSPPGRLPRSALQPWKRAQRGRAPRRSGDDAPPRGGAAARLGGGASQPRQRAGVAGPGPRGAGALASCRGACAERSADRVRPGHAAARGGTDTRSRSARSDEAVRLDPNDAAAHNNLGIALGSVGRLDEARRAFERALALQPGFEDARRNLDLARGAGAR